MQALGFATYWWDMVAHVDLPLWSPFGGMTASWSQSHRRSLSASRVRSGWGSGSSCPGPPALSLQETDLWRKNADIRDAISALAWAVVQHPDSQQNTMAMLLCTARLCQDYLQPSLVPCVTTSTFQKWTAILWRWNVDAHYGRVLKTKVTHAILSPFGMHLSMTTARTRWSPRWTTQKCVGKYTYSLSLYNDCQ